MDRFTERFHELLPALKAALEERDPGYLASWWAWLWGRIDPDARYRQSVGRGGPGGCHWPSRPS